MTKTGFQFGQCVRFVKSENEQTIGYILGPTNLNRPYDFVDEKPIAFPREYFMIHRDGLGTIVHDPSVQESYIRPFTGWIPEDIFAIQKFLRNLVENNTPRAPDAEE